ncbi:hypothetical protein GUJ93_ZPchr0005g15494 [Zizania palustris]|uniref:Uncharacterized protein n=1 Tax=Zizania palustris TaxID=103762 RepID=A0A8J5SML4_ZIZPA|nr:hypothetical protein GUJ93_ZPchr0005g15494 [Zizania palustris]
MPSCKSESPSSLSTSFSSPASAPASPFHHRLPPSPLPHDIVLVVALEDEDAVRCKVVAHIKSSKALSFLILLAAKAVSPTAIDKVVALMDSTFEKD